MKRLVSAAESAKMYVLKRRFTSKALFLDEMVFIFFKI
jgi:hypothetical protein